MSLLRKINHLPPFFFLILSFFVYFSCSNEGKQKGEETKSLYVETNQAYLEAKKKKDEKEMKKVIKKFSKVYNYAVVALEKEYQGLLYLARLHMEKKFYSRAIEVFEKIHFLYPYKKIHYFEMGLCYFNLYTTRIKKDRKKYFNLSEKIFVKGLELFPKENDLQYGIGLLYGMYGKINEDKDYLNKGVEYLLKVSSLSYLYNSSLFSIAHFSLLLGNKTRAILSYQKILERTKKKSQEYKQATENLKQLQ